MAIDPELVEKYQIEYERNPSSRIFAPLGEAYRQMGMLKEAFAVCSNGVQKHPDFAGGRVAFAKVLIDQNQTEAALAELEKAVELSPDNHVAHSLRGDLLLSLRRPREALESFKMVLFLKPEDEKAKKIVQKWEFLSADDYEDELFEMQPVFKAPVQGEKPVALSPLPEGNTPAPVAAWRARDTERAISLADAFTVRGELDKAYETLRKALFELGSTPELDKRMKLLSRKTGRPEVDPTITGTSNSHARKRQILETLLNRINERRAEG